MSVNIVPTQQPGTWLQRLTGTEPRTVVHETSTTTISSTPGGSFNLRTALRNGGIGAAVAGALGGVSLLGRVALPLIGKVGSVSGLVRLAGVGGALGIATAALPIIAPRIQQSPMAKAAVIGAGIGAAAGAVLPLMPISIGAAIGAGVGLMIHNRRNRPDVSYQTYPGYTAHPGYVPYGTNPGARVPPGLVPVTPNFGAYAGSAMNPYGHPGAVSYAGAGSPYGGSYAAAGYPSAGYPSAGYPSAGYPAAGYPAAYPGGYASMALPMHASTPAAPGPQAQAVAPASTGAAKRPKYAGAKSFTDGAGNLRQVGTGTVLRPSTRTTGSPIGSVAMGTAAPVGLPSVQPPPIPDRPTAG